MEETPNAVLNGLSPEARRNVIETAAATPRDKENAGANSTRHSQSAATVDQTKTSSSSSASVASAAAAAAAGPPPSARTPARSRLTNQQRSSPSFFSCATTPSPASTNNKSSLPAGSFITMDGGQPTSSAPMATSAAAATTTKYPTTPAPPPSVPSLNAQKSPPGTSQVLRKHFQSLGFATPPPAASSGSKHHQQRLISSGAVRLTPNSRKKAHKGNHHHHHHSHSMTSSRSRIGFDGTKFTPSKELLKSTASSRNQRVLALQHQQRSDFSLDQEEEQPTTLDEEEDDDEQLQHYGAVAELNQLQSGIGGGLDMLMDDESSAGASAASAMDDASFDMSLPGMNSNNNQYHHHQPSFLVGSSNMNSTSHVVIPAPHSPLTPRMGCLNPVALTLLNDGKEDYNYLLTQDALYPIPKVEDTMEPLSSSSMPSVSVGAAGAYHHQPQQQLHPGGTNTSMSSSSSTSSSVCLSPTQTFGQGGHQSPAEVRGTLSHTVKSTLARPVAIMAKTGRISPSQPRLLMRPQPKHVR